MYNPLLQTFVTVVENGSFTKAAAKLFISDVAVRKQIGVLEDHLGVKLVERTHTGITVTAAGQIIYEDAKRMIRSSMRSIEKAKKAAGMELYTIKIATSLLRSCKVLMDRWNRMGEDTTAFRIELVTFDDEPSSFSKILSSLGKNIDCVVSTYALSSQIKEISTYQLGTYRCCIAVSRNHRLAVKTTVSLSDLCGETLLLAKRGSSLVLDNLRDEIEQHYPQIHLMDIQNMYDTSVFNQCEKNGYVMELLDVWREVHPALVTIPVKWEYEIPYGIMYSKHPSKGMKAFIELFSK